MALSGICSVVLGGVDLTAKVASINISEIINETSSCQIETTLFAPGDVPEFEPYAVVTVTDDNEMLVFGGRVDGVPGRIEEPKGTRLTIAASDWSAECSFRLVRDHYQDWVISDIYKAIVAKYLPGHTTNGVEDNLDTVSLKFNGETVADVLKTLCDLAGWSWSVDSSRNHTFGPAFIETFNLEINDGNCDTTLASTGFAPDYSTLANRVWVEGGEGVSRNFTSQFICVEDIGLTDDPSLWQEWPHRLPVWYTNDGIMVYGVFDKGDGNIENGQLVKINVGKCETVAGAKTVVPENTEQNPYLKTNTAETNVIMQYDGMYDPKPSLMAEGGFVYLHDSLSRGIFGESATPSCFDGQDMKKFLGFALRYKRKIKLSYQSQADEESVGKYGVQIDLPKVVRSSVKDWSVLYRYAEYLLSTHKDPPMKGRVCVWRFKDGEEIYPIKIKPGQLAEVDLERHGNFSPVKVTKVRHEIAPTHWKMHIESSLDPNLYTKMFCDILKRIALMENRDDSNQVISSIASVSSGISIADVAPEFDSLTSSEDYGFDRSLFGGSEWE